MVGYFKLKTIIEFYEEDNKIFDIHAGINGAIHGLYQR